MKTTKSSTSDKSRRELEIAGALAAMRRAAKVAHRRAAERGDKIPISKDGKVVWIEPIVEK